MAVLPWYIRQDWRKSQTRAAIGLLGLLVLLPMLLLPLGQQLRDHYILPALGPLAILLAAGTLRAFAQASRRRLFGLLLLHGVLGVAAMLYLFHLDWRRYATVDPYPLLALLGILGVMMLAVWRGEPTPLRIWLSICFATVMSFTAAAESPSFWSQDRYAEQYLGQAVAARVPRQAPLLAINGNEEALAFYARRPVVKLRSFAELTATQVGQPELPVYLAWYGKPPATWPAELQAQVVWQGQMKGEAPLTLIRLSRMQKAQETPTALSVRPRRREHRQG